MVLNGGGGRTGWDGKGPEGCDTEPWGNCVVSPDTGRSQGREQRSGVRGRVDFISGWY